MIGLIVGGATGNYDERAEALTVLEGADLLYLAVNEAGIEHPDPLDHWVSLHPEKFEGWERVRVERGLSADYQKWTQEARRRHATNSVRNWKDGSSGLTAIDAALNKLDCTGVVLCGIPMDDSVNVYHGRAWGQHRRYRKGFQTAIPEFGDRVRSMSGWTRDRLGFPDRAWVAYIEGVAV